MNTIYAEKIGSGLDTLSNAVSDNEFGWSFGIVNVLKSPIKCQKKNAYFSLNSDSIYDWLPPREEIMKYVNKLLFLT